jgi:hypothetical protein
MPHVLPVQAISRGRSIRWSVEVIVSGPAFHRNCAPSLKPPSRWAELTSGFQLGQSSIEVSTSHTTSGLAATSTSAQATAGALSFTFTGQASY